MAIDSSFPLKVKGNTECRDRCILPFLTLLQITDSLFPIGGYTQSNGLETYIQKEIVKDRITAEKYLRNALLYNVAYNDALCMKFAWEYARNGEIEKIIRLDELMSAIKAPIEIRQGSNKLGARFIKIINRLAKNELVSNYDELIRKGSCSGHYAILFGIFSYAANIPEKEALTAFLYSAASAIVNNCVKLVPLSQIDGQAMLYNIHGLISETLEKMEQFSIDDIGLCNPGFEIRSMQHERLYSRLYMS